MPRSITSRLLAVALGLVVVVTLFGLGNSAVTAALSTVTQLPFVSKGWAMALPNPTVTGTLGTGNNQPTIIVQGTALPNSVVRLYFDAGCTASASTQSLSLSTGFWSVVATSNPPQTGELLFVRLQNGPLQQFSNCSFALSVPPAPLVAGSTPSSSAANRADSPLPAIFGSSAAGSTVTLFTDANCAGTVAATTTANNDSYWIVNVPVQPNTTTTFWAQARDTSGDISPCSSAVPLTQFQSVAYFSAATPSAPFIAVSNPPSPSTNASPFIYGGGAAFNGGLVLLFVNSGCTGQISQATAAFDGSFEFSGFGLGTGTTSLYVGQNGVNCSANPFFYTVVGQPAQIPQITSVTGSGATPTFGITGAPPNSVVFIYSSFNGSSGCDPTTADGQGTADATGFATVQPAFPMTSPTTFWPDAQTNNNFTACGNGFLYSP